MKFITKEQFLSQSPKAQEVLIKWWGKNNSKTDLVVNPGNLTIELLGDKDPYYFLPLFTEGQLREFIEEKLNSRFHLINDFGDVYTIQVGNEDEKFYETVDKEVLETYWKVACEISAEED